LKFLNIEPKYYNLVKNTNHPHQDVNIPIDVDITGLRVVISYSLYANAQKYIGGLITNCKLINLHFPDFWIYVFVGNDFDHSILSRLETFNNIKIIETAMSGHINMFYRFSAIDHDEVGIAFSRDCDSYVNQRDRYCIQKFLESNKKFQIIRDHEFHLTEILGGLWGIKKGMLRLKIIDKVNEFFYSRNGFIQHGNDQHFLTKEIYPHVRDYSQIFDDFFQLPGETPEKIVGIPYEPYNHVGVAAMFINYPHIDLTQV
jgi:hypothetical protein